VFRFDDPPFSHAGSRVLTKSEERVLRVFEEYLMSPGSMLCFSGPTYKRDKEALELLTDKKLLVKEKFEGGYSLTRSGYVAMKHLRV
jgi:hypothetical protein